MNADTPMGKESTKDDPGYIQELLDLNHELVAALQAIADTIATTRGEREIRDVARSALEKAGVK